MYYVYILRSEIDGSHYHGLSGNINRRYLEHNNGKCQSTKSRRPWKLIHVEIAINRTSARKIEKFFKSGFGREIIQDIEDTLKI